MKKRIIMLGVALMLLSSGCGKSRPEATQPPVETTLPAETVQEVEYRTAQVNGIAAVLDTLSRGDVVDLVDTFDEKHYVVKLETGYGLVEKNLVRPEGEKDFEAWTGYAYADAAVYDNYRLAGTPVRKLKAKDAVNVLENLGWCYLVQLGETTGYMKPEALARTPQEDSPSGGVSGSDGGEISLNLLSVIAPQSGSVRGRAKVLADETQVVLGYFDRGDRIPVVEETGDTLTVCLEGVYATVSREYVCREEVTQKTWEGLSLHNAAVYKDYWMQGSPMDRLNADTPVQVLYELEDCYLVQVGSVQGYIPKEKVEPVEEIPETEPAATESPKPAATQPKKQTESTKPTEPKATESTKPAATEPKVPESTEPAVTEPESTTATTPTEPATTEPAVTEPEETTQTEPTQAPTQPPAKVDPEWTPPKL